MTEGEKIVIGIDPGISTRVCVWDTDNMKFLHFSTLSFWPTITVLSKYRREYGDGLAVVIEDPNLNKAMHWGNKGSVKGFNPATKIAQNVGQNKKEAELIIKYLESNGVKFQAIKPTSKKVNAEQFKSFSGYEGRTNQHVRDAGMLVLDYCGKI